MPSPRGPVRRLSHEEIVNWYVFMAENKVAWCDMKRVSHDNNLPGPGTVLEQIPWILKEIKDLKEELIRVKMSPPMFRETEAEARGWDD